MNRIERGIALACLLALTVAVVVRLRFVATADGVLDTWQMRVCRLGVCEPIDADSLYRDLLKP